MESSPKHYTAVNRSRACTLGNRIRLAGDSRDRRRGLLDEATLAEGAGLWIIPCEAIHTCGMKVAIDVVFIDKRGTVRKLSHNIRPFRLSVCWRAHSVIELPAGTIKKSGTLIGDQLELLRAS